MEVGIIAIDGTKIRANASRGANRTYEKLVADILKEAEETDRWEDGLFGPDRGDESQRCLDLRCQEIEVELVWLVRVERMEPQSLPPDAGAGAKCRNDDCSAGRFLVELDGGGEHVRRECGPDPEVLVTLVDGEATEQQRWDRIGSAFRHRFGSR